MNKNKIEEEYSIKYLDVNIVEHCNLNCAYCYHCSSIAEPEFLDIIQYEKDVRKISQITKGRIKNTRANARKKNE